MFVLQRGAYKVAKLEYSYGRRAQSTVHTLQWKDVALINTESIQEAIAEAKAAIHDWSKQGYKSERWRIEGRGRQINECCDLE